MLPFLLVYLSVYTLLHYYAFRKIRAAFLPNRRGRLGIALFMAVMIAAPIMIRLAERKGIETGAGSLAYASFSWMGLLFLFVTIAGSVDLLRLAIRMMEKIRQRKISKAKISLRRMFTAQAILAVAFYSYGLFEAANIRLERLEIVSPKITRKPGRIRIAQISDVHLGLIVREGRLQRIIAEIRQAKPDILVSTGDLVDGQPSHLDKEAELLAALNPPLGKIAITGNHEFYAGLQVASAFTEASGFTLLRQRGMVVGGINFVGVDDPAVKTFAQETTGSEHDILSAQPKENFTVLLKHRPEIDPGSTGLFDLQLSGHTHKGQIFPFNLLTWFFYPLRAGQLTSLNSGLLYLSRGTGTWGPPIRFLAPPEVTIIDLVHGE